MALREILADLQIRVRGGEQLQRANQQIGGAVSGLRTAGRALGAAGAALTSALAIRQVVSFTSELIRAGDEIDKMSQSLGLSAQALQRWQFIAERSGVSSQQLSAAFIRLTRSAGAAAEGVAGPVSAYRALGISVRDANGELREGEDLFRATILGLAEVENATRRSFLATELFGRAGAQLLPIVNSGAAGIEELTARFEELGGAMSDEAVAAAAEAQDSIADFELVMTSLKGQLSAAFLPTLTRVINGIANFTAMVLDALESSSAFETILGVLSIAAIALGLALAPVVASTIALLLPFILIALAIEDVVTAFRGGRSQIALFIDELFGVGTAQEIIDDLTAAWEGLTLAIQRGLAAIRGEELPTASGRAVEVTPEERRAAAARGGRIVGARGQSFEEARAAANEARAEAGLGLFDESGQVQGRPRVARRGRGQELLRGMRRAGIPRDVAAEGGRVRARVARGAVATGGDTNIEQNIRSDTTINVEGAGDPEAVAAAITRRQDQRLRRVLADAAATLPQGT